MKILTERTANLSYGKIKNVHNDTNQTSKEKTPKLKWSLSVGQYLKELKGIVVVVGNTCT